MAESVEFLQIVDLHGVHNLAAAIICTMSWVRYPEHHPDTMAVFEAAVLKLLEHALQPDLTQRAQQLWAIHQVIVSGPSSANAAYEVVLRTADGGSKADDAWQLLIARVV